MVNEHEKKEFKELVNLVIKLKDDSEKLFYRGSFRWLNEKGKVCSNCYEMFCAETVAQNLGLKIKRKYGDSIFVTLK